MRPIGNSSIVHFCSRILPTISPQALPTPFASLTSVSTVVLFKHIVVVAALATGSCHSGRADSGGGIMWGASLYGPGSTPNGRLRETYNQMHDRSPQSLPSYQGKA